MSGRITTCASQEHYKYRLLFTLFPSLFFLFLKKTPHHINYLKFLFPAIHPSTINMKLTLIALGLAALAAATPASDELFERATSACSNGVQDPENGPCTYTVTCNTKGTTTNKALGNTTGSSFASCLDSCQNYAEINDANCYSVNYQKKTKTCFLYASSTFSSTKKNVGYNSAVVYGCG